MAFPYRVTVKKKGDDIHVTVDPQPIATKEAYLPVIVKRFQGIIMKPRENTIFSRASLKHEIIEALKDFHSQGMIVPKTEKEKDETTR
jgi:hypothetical protein